MSEHRIFFIFDLCDDIVTLGVFPVRENAYPTPIRVRSGGVVADRDGFWTLVAAMGWTLGENLDLPGRLL